MLASWQQLCIWHILHENFESFPFSFSFSLSLVSVQPMFVCHWRQRCGKLWQGAQCLLIKSHIQHVTAQSTPVSINLDPFYTPVFLFEVVCLLQGTGFGCLERNPYYFSLKFINMLCLAFNIHLFNSSPSQKCFILLLPALLTPIVIIIWHSDSIKSNGKMLLSN